MFLDTCESTKLKMRSKLYASYILVLIMNDEWCLEKDQLLKILKKNDSSMYTFPDPEKFFIYEASDLEILRQVSVP